MATSVMDHALRYEVLVWENVRWIMATKSKRLLGKASAAAFSAPKRADVMEVINHNHQVVLREMPSLSILASHCSQGTKTYLVKSR